MQSTQSVVILHKNSHTKSNAYPISVVIAFALCNGDWQGNERVLLWTGSEKWEPTIWNHKTSALFVLLYKNWFIRPMIHGQTSNLFELVLRSWESFRFLGDGARSRFFKRALRGKVWALDRPLQLIPLCIILSSYSPLLIDSISQIETLGTQMFSIQYSHNWVLSLNTYLLFLSVHFTAW